MAAADQPAAGALAAPVDAKGQPDVVSVERRFQRDHRVDREIAAKDVAHEIGVFLDDMQRAVLDPIAERDDPAHPEALLLRGGDLVADPLARDLAFELGEGEQHVEGEPAHAGRRVEGLRHRDERDAAGVEAFDQFGEVGQRAGQPVDLVDHDHVDPAFLDIGEQLLQGGPLHRAAGEAAVVIAIAQKRPAFVRLAPDKSLRCLALVVEGVEVLFEPGVGGDAGIDRAAELRLRPPWDLPVAALPFPPYGHHAAP